ncbi:MAG: thioredoxin family protein [Spirochaetales bacterium]|nr:thioredoxin family protein [Spirochaetales bacterium]
MNSFHEYKTLQEVKEFINSGRMRIVYLSRPSCGVCTVIKMKVLDIIGKYPELEGTYVNMDIIPESAGEFSIFTIPGIILYIDGKESIREARYVSIEELEGKIDRFYNMIYS